VLTKVIGPDQFFTRVDFGAEFAESVRHFCPRFATDLALEFQREHNNQKQKTKKNNL
jgi:hypothetical protein